MLEVVEVGGMGKFVKMEGNMIWAGVMRGGRREMGELEKG